MATVNPDDFKGALGSWATGVTVVTTRSGDQLYGLTISSFSSLSVDPLLVLVCVMNNNKFMPFVQESRHFAISILAEDQDEIATWFSRSGRDPVAKFEFPTEAWHTGSPIISGAIAHLDCELHDIFPGGDHQIVVGSVVGAAFDPVRKPLLYYRRAYRKLVLE